MQTNLALVCPFTDADISVIRAGPLVFGRVQSPDGIWRTRAFGSEDQLVQALSRRSEVALSMLPAQSVIRLDPFDGGEIEFVERQGDWVAKGRLWTTERFGFRSEAEWFVSWRHGRPPAFAKRPVIKVKEIEEPPTNPAAVKAADGKDLRNEIRAELDQTADDLSGHTKGKRTRVK